MLWIQLHNKLERELALKVETVEVANKSKRVVEVVAAAEVAVEEVMKVSSSLVRITLTPWYLDQKTFGSLNSMPLGVVTVNNLSQNTMLLLKD
jgi:hypothetical protein